MSLTQHDTPGGLQLTIDEDTSQAFRSTNNWNCAGSVNASCARSWRNANSDSAVSRLTWKDTWVYSGSTIYAWPLNANDSWPARVSYFKRFLHRGPDKMLLSGVPLARCLAGTPMFNPSAGAPTVNHPAGESTHLTSTYIAIHSFLITADS